VDGVKINKNMGLIFEETRHGSYSLIENELDRAEEQHPNFPEDIFEQLAIMTEEAGEVAKAVLKYKQEKRPLQDVKDELIQTAAMCVRMLEAISSPGYTGISTDKKHGDAPSGVNVVVNISSLGGEYLNLDNSGVSPDDLVKALRFTTQKVIDELALHNNG